MAKMRNEGVPIPFHMDNIITKCDDKLFYFFSRRYGIEVASVEIKDEFLTKIFFFVFMFCIQHTDNGIKIGNTCQERNVYVSPERESDSRPTSYQEVALPLSHPGNNLTIVSKIQDA